MERDNFKYLGVRIRKNKMKTDLKKSGQEEKDRFQLAPNRSSGSLS